MHSAPCPHVLRPGVNRLPRASSMSGEPTIVLGAAVAVLLATLLLMPSLAVGTSSSPAWKRLSPSFEPKPRTGYSMASGPGNNTTLLFGGAYYGYLRNGTFSFDGTTWTRINTTA